MAKKSAKAPRTKSRKWPPALYIVGAPIGNPLDWTIRALEILKDVDVVAAEDTRVVKRELTKHGITPKRVVSFNQNNENPSSEGLMKLILEGQSVALVSDAGTPQVSDPGFRIVEKAVTAGVTVVPVPGVSSLTCALSVSPIGGVNHFFGGFVPTQTGARQKMFRDSQHKAERIIFFEAPHRLRESLNDALLVFGEEAKAAVLRELTKPYEEIIYKPIKDLISYFAATEPRGEFTLIFCGASAPKFTKADTLSEIKRLRELGRSASDIVSELSPLSELNRKEIYDMVTSLKSKEII